MARGSTRKDLLILLICLGGVAVVAAALESNGTAGSKSDGTTVVPGNATEKQEEPLETFQELEKKVKNSVGSAIKNILPFLMRGSSDTKASGQCIASVMKVIGGIRQLKEWAMRFVDATGKIPPGILEGTSFSIGDFDECLDISVGRKDEPPATPADVLFTGRYCLMELHRPETINRAIREFEDGNPDAPIAKSKTFLNMFVRYKHLTNSTMKVGVCVPSKCSQEDIESIMSSEAIRSQIGKVTVPYCEIKGESEVSTEQIILVCMFGVYIFFITLGTIADAIFRLRENSDSTKSKDSNTLRYFVQKTSIYQNALNVLSTQTTSTIQCLCGLRTFIVVLVIYSHSYAHLHILHFQKFSKAANFLRFFESFTFSGIGNGSVILDSIVLVSGVVITYNRWRFLPKGENVNINTAKLFFHRYFRMSAAQLLVICIFLLFPLIGSGPFWTAYMDPVLKNCHKRWWLNLLYVSNFWEATDICVYNTWILALLMQLTLLAIIVLWIMKKSIKFGIFFMVIVILAGIIGVGIMTVIHELPGSLAFFMLEKRTFQIAWNDIYTLPYDHMGPFCIGLLVGYFLAVQKDRLEISWLTSTFMWCCSVATSMAVMFGLYAYRKGDRIETPLAAFYAVMHRNAWSAAIGWMIVACSTHHGGPISRVLKSKFFVPLDRMCYMAYLLHIPIMFYHSGTMRERWYMGHLEIMFLGLSYISLSFILSFFLNVLFVEPFNAFENYAVSLFRVKDKVIFASATPEKSSSPPSTIAETTDFSSDSAPSVTAAHSTHTDKV